MKIQRALSAVTLRSPINGLIALLLTLSISMVGTAGHAIEVTSCNFPIVQFTSYDSSNLFEPWDVDDGAGVGFVWDTVEGCGQAGNFTGGSGNAMCVSAPFNGPPFDTSLESNIFSLKGCHWRSHSVSN